MKDKGPGRLRKTSRKWLIIVFGEGGAGVGRGSSSHKKGRTPELKRKSRGVCNSPIMARPEGTERDLTQQRGIGFKSIRQKSHRRKSDSRGENHLYLHKLGVGFRKG